MDDLESSDLRVLQADSTRSKRAGDSLRRTPPQSPHCRRQPELNLGSKLHFLGAFIHLDSGHVFAEPWYDGGDHQVLDVIDSGSCDSDHLDTIAARYKIPWKMSP